MSIQPLSWLKQETKNYMGLLRWPKSHLSNNSVKLHNTVWLRNAIGAKNDEYFSQHQSCTVIQGNGFFSSRFIFFLIEHMIIGPHKDKKLHQHMKAFELIRILLINNGFGSISDFWCVRLCLVQSLK